MRLLIACSVLFAGPAIALTPVERKDIADSLGPALCTSPTVPSALPLGLWEKGISDAQIEGRLLEQRFSVEINLSQAQRKAKSLARMRRYQGYAYGTCSDGRAWALALPAPAPLERTGEKLAVPALALHETCESWRVDYARNNGGTSVPLRSHGGTIDIKTLEPGVVSVSCQPRKPRWQGPAQWYLTPIGLAPSAEVPGAESLKNGQTSEAGLIAWINQVRSQNQRRPLVVHADLTSEAGILAIDPSLTHNRKMLTAASTTLAGQKLRFLGENRVKGRDLHEMAWLLWYSPRHRSLLLNEEARWLGVTLRNTREGKLAVIVIGSDATTRIGKNLKENGKPSATKQ